MDRKEPNAMIKLFRGFFTLHSGEVVCLWGHHPAVYSRMLAVDLPDITNSELPCEKLRGAFYSKVPC